MRTEWKERCNNEINDKEHNDDENYDKKTVNNVKPVSKLMEQTASESTSDSEPTVSHKANKSVKMNNENIKVISQKY